MKLDIRAAGPQEAAVVSEILTEAALWLRESRTPLWSSEQLTREQVAPDCESGFFFLACSDGVALGTMRLTDADPSFWPEAEEGEAVYLHRLAVRRAAAGGLVSSALLRHAGQTATERGARFLRLDCESNRPRLRAFYERCGFEFHSEHTVRGVHVARYQLSSGRGA